MNTTSLDLSADIIDTCDIIERIEQLETIVEEMSDTDSSGKDAFRTESQDLIALMEELKGYGGDEQWRGNWYPSTLIRDSHFRDYAIDLAHDMGELNCKWPYNCIDWDQAARELRLDYSSVDIGGVVYWYR